METISNYTPTGALETANLHLIIDNILFLRGQDKAGDSVTETDQQFSEPVHLHSQTFLIALIEAKLCIPPLRGRLVPQWKEALLHRSTVNRRQMTGTALVLEEDIRKLEDMMPGQQLQNKTGHGQGQGQGQGQRAITKPRRLENLYMLINSQGTSLSGIEISLKEVRGYLVGKESWRQIVGAT